MTSIRMHRTLGLAVALLIAGCGANEGPQSTANVVHVPASAAEVAAYGNAQPLLQQHCLICHTEKPAMPGYRTAPAGVVLESAEELRRFAPRVLAVVELQQMPPLNITAMLDDDRNKLIAVIRTQWPEMSSKR